MSPCTTLQPKKPAYRVAKSKSKSKSKPRKPFIRYNRRDQGLTPHQRAWARSLSGSLAGWRARTWWNRARVLEGRRHEEEGEEQWGEGRDGFRAEADDDDEEEDAGTPAVDIPDSFSEDFSSSSSSSSSYSSDEEDPSEEARKAAWAAKARQMHLAGSGSQIIAAWDPVRRMYLRDHAIEACRARLAAARQAAFDGYDSGEGSESEGGDEDGKGEDAEVNDVDLEGASDPHTMSAPQPTGATSPAPMSAPVPVADWRVKARSGVEKKKLSVTKEWSALTWNQKSNIKERFLVLEDDGVVDVRVLMDRKATSDEVTALILARAAELAGGLAEEQEEEGEEEAAGEGESAQTAPTGLPTFTPINGPGSAFRPALQTAGSRSLQTSVGAGSTPPYSPADEDGDEDTTQPFSLNEPYRPQPSHARKRKRPHEEDTSNKKKKKVGNHPTEEVLAAQTLDEMKQKRLRGVFRPARSVHGEGGSVSCVVFVHAADKALCISVRGFEHVMREVRFLGDADDEDGEVALEDPDLGPESSDGFSGAEERDAAMAGVTVTKHRLGYTVMQGETRVLAGLFKMLAEEKLLHRTGWEWDGLALRAADGFVWELSAETQRVLREVEGMLRDGVVDEAGGVEVLVGVGSA